jgi:hypothetical protein
MDDKSVWDSYQCGIKLISGICFMLDLMQVAAYICMHLVYSTGPTVDRTFAIPYCINIYMVQQYHISIIL